MALLPAHITEAISKIPHELLEMDEHDLQKLVNPSLSLDRLRLAFWVEYDLAQSQTRHMHVPSIYRGAMNRTYFQQVVLKKPEILAYVICPPADYMLSLKAMLYRTIKQLEKLTEANLIDEKTGEIKLGLARLVIDAHKALDLKVYGAAIQKIESKVMTVTATVDSLSKDEDVEKRLSELREKAQKISQGNFIDVGPEKK